MFNYAKDDPLKRSDMSRSTCQTMRRTQTRINAYRERADKGFIALKIPRGKPRGMCSLSRFTWCF